MIVDRDVLRLAPAMLAIAEAAVGLRSSSGYELIKAGEEALDDALSALRAQMGGAS